MEMRYFKSVQGKAFLRPGKPGIYIGCKRKGRDPTTGVSPGFVWNTDAVTSVTVAECNQNLRDYNDAVRDAVLIEVQSPIIAKPDEASAPKSTKAAKKAAKKASKAAEQTNTEEG